MQLSVAVLSCGLALASAALIFADYSHDPVESPRGIRLGRFYLVDDGGAVEEARIRLDKLGSAAALKVFGPALERNPGSAFRWIDVGMELLAAGDRKNADYCYRIAGQRAPHDPQILYDLGDYYAGIGKPLPAVDRFSQLLRQAPANTIVHNVFVYYEGLKVRQDGLLDQAIPDAQNARAYTRYLIQQGDDAPVRELWHWTIKNGFEDDRLAIDYVDYLVRKKQFDAAEEGWSKHFALRQDGYPRSTRVFNGGFEYELTGSILDWRFQKVDGVSVNRDSTAGHEGHASLRIDFSGNDNADFRQLRQTVLVKPGLYHFEAFARTAAITSDEGIRFRLWSEQGSRGLSVETEALTGTNDWKRLQANFDIPPGIETIEVQLARRRSIRIDNQLTGTAWIDAVKLTRLQ